MKPDNQARRNEMLIQHRVLINGICEKYGVDEVLLFSKVRKEKVVDARSELAKDLRGRGYSLPKIGLLLNRDHSSIIHLLRREAA